MNLAAEYRAGGDCSYLDHREHSLVGLGVGVDLKALPWVPVDDGVDSSPSPRGGVVPVTHSQVHYYTCDPLLHCGLELGKKHRGNHYYFHLMTTHSHEISQSALIIYPSSRKMESSTETEHCGL